MSMMKGVERLARSVNLEGAKTTEEKAALIRKAGEAAQTEANLTGYEQWLIKRRQGLTHVTRAYLKATDRIICRIPPVGIPKVDDQQIRII